MCDSHHAGEERERSAMNWVALKMLTGDRVKYFGMILGISLASLLMTHQMTIFVGILSRTHSIVSDLTQVDILVMDAETEFLDDVKPIPETSLQRVRSVEGVEWAVPLYKGPIRARQYNGKYRACIVMGVDDTTLIGGPTTMVEGSVADLRTHDGVIIDVIDAERLLSSPSTTPDGPRRPLAVGDSLELNDNRVTVVGICKNSRPFISQPIIYTTYSRALKFAPRERNMTSFICVKARPGEDANTLCDRISRATGYRAATREGFSWQTIAYYLRNTGIPVNFGITILLGIIVGTAIAGQTFYLFTMDNLKYFAALKAMGGDNWTLLRMTMLQSIVVGIIGYGLGVGGAALFFYAFKGTELDFKFYWQLPGITAVMITLVCLASAAASLNRVFRLEPSIVFKG